MSFFGVLKGIFNNDQPKEIKVDESGSLFTVPQSITSTTNNTTTPLSTGQAWSGSGEQNTYRDVMVVCKTDAPGTLYFDFSPDGTNWDSTLSYTLAANSPEFHVAEKGPRYYRTRISSSGDQSYIRLYTYYGDFRQGNLPLNLSISSDADAIVTRAVQLGEDPLGAYTNNKVDGYAFITTSSLASGSTYTSSIIALSPGFSQVQTHILADQDGTIKVYWYSDSAGSNQIRTLSIPYTSGSGFQMFGAPAFAPYVKYTYENGSQAQGNFYFDTKFTTKAINGQVLSTTAPIAAGMTANLGRNIIVGQDNAGNFRNTGVDLEGHLKVNIDEPLTAFGELSVAIPTPEVQVDFVYGGNNQLITSSVAINGQVTYSDGLVNVTTSGSIGSSAIAYTTKFTKYRPGQGAEGRFTALFTTGSSGVNQYAGLSTPSLATMITFGYSGSSFGIWHKSSGSFSNFISQSSWNEDKMDGSRSLNNPSGQLLDPTKGNVYQIKYQYLGFGGIYCYIEDSSTGTFEPVHKIEYANANTVTSFRNPSFSLLWAAENVSGTGLATVKGASGATFVEGQLITLGPKNSVDNNKSLSANTSTVILSLKNASSYNGIPNRAITRLKAISLASDMGNTNAGIQVLQVWKQITLNTSSFIAINGTTVNNGDTITNGNSTVSYDTAGASITTSSLSYNVFNMSVARNANMTQDVSEFGLNIYPGEIMTFLTKTIGGGTQQSSVSVNWTEDI